MKIGIIIYSQTGNTYSVALKLKENLIKSGLNADIERITTADNKQNDFKNIRIDKLPDLSGYNVLIFGAPVQGFALSPVMKAYFSKVSSFSNKKTACYVTHQFPYPWMGGNQAIKQMKKLCEEKGAVICGNGIIDWSNKNRERKITELIENFNECLK